MIAVEELGLVRTILYLTIIQLAITSISATEHYAMYVWTNGFDKDVAGCNEAQFMNWDTNGPCFTHAWNSVEKRKWLWATCNLEGREIDTLFVSGVKTNLQAAYDSGDCSSEDISMVKQTLVEGHKQVANLKIYGLYADSDMAVSEKDHVKYIVHYNDVCAGNQSERFDGVATNNEAYAGIKCGDMTDRLEYLDNLNVIVSEARKQVNGHLLTHYSVSWHWGICGGSEALMTWNGITSNATRHMIDIFDSTDVQVGYMIYPAVSDRTIIAGYNYAVSMNKTIFTTLYTNKGTLCQTTFFPDENCHIKGHNESSMFYLFDGFASHGIGSARPCIHYFRGVYSTGAYAGWPVHQPLCGK